MTLYYSFHYVKPLAGKCSIKENPWLLQKTRKALSQGRSEDHPFWSTGAHLSPPGLSPMEDMFSCFTLPQLFMTASDT